VRIGGRDDKIPECHHHVGASADLEQVSLGEQRDYVLPVAV
jgi:hypothetical protein